MDITLAQLTAWFQGLERPYPARDWVIVASLALVLFVAGAVFAGYLFWGTQTGSIIAAGQEAPRPTIPVTRDAIQKVLEVYEARATNYAGGNFVTVNLTDPRAR